MCIEPPLPLVAAAGAAVQLAHHPRHVGALGQRVAVAAVGRGQQVVAAQVDAHAGGHGLLAGGQMQRPAHFRRRGRRFDAPGLHAALAGRLGRVLEGADARHRPVKPQQPRRPARLALPCPCPHFFESRRVFCLRGVRAMTVASPARRAASTG
jgi:hypothetical protein